MLMTFISLHTALYLSLSFVILILNKLFSPIMMSFCRKSVHSLLGLSKPTITTTDDERNDLNPRAIWSKGLISLIPETTNDAATTRRSPNVLESSTLIALPKTPPQVKDPGGIGFIDEIGGGVDGLMSCTESLGFESSDERRIDDDQSTGEELRSFQLSDRYWRRRRRISGAGAGERKFPPPLSSLNRNGQPSFFLRPMRKDGRLELTEVRINRPEILRAYRGNGRLRLHLIRNDDDEDENENEEDCIEEEKEEEEEEEEKWRIEMSKNGGGEQGNSFRRCQEKLELNQYGVGHQTRRLHVAV